MKVLGRTICYRVDLLYVGHPENMKKVDAFFLSSMNKFL